MNTTPPPASSDQHIPLTDGTGASHINLSIGGMTCASCVGRVEKKLRKLPGVEATVNLATESARVSIPDSLSAQDIIATIEKAGYSATLITEETVDDQAEHSPSHTSPERTHDLGVRLAVAFTLSVPVMALAMIPAIQFTGWQWLSAALTLPVALWCAAPFHVAAWRAGKHGSATMDTLVSLGVIASTAWSLWALIWGGAGTLGMRMPMEFMPAHQSASAHIYFESAAWVTTFLLAGRYAEARSRRRAGDALRSLMELGATTARIVESTTTRTLPVDDVRVGDVMRVLTGEKIPTDGQVIAGTGSVDASMVTGESLPVDVHAGDDVTGATIVTSGSIDVRATRVGAGTTLAQITHMVTAAQEGKAPIARLADRVSAIFVPIVLLLSALTLAGWLIAGQPTSAAFTAAVAVLVIACPCALGLATPTALLVGSGRAAKLGIIISGPEVLESTRRIDTVIMDKTGTITTGSMSVASITCHPDSPLSSTDVITLAALVESHSTHPIAQAIVRKAEDYLHAADDDAHRSNVTLSDIHTLNGQGIEATAHFSPEHPLADYFGDCPIVIRVGSHAWMNAQGVDFSWADDDIDASGGEGGSIVLLAVHHHGAWHGSGVIDVRDSLRSSSAQAITDLRARGLEPLMLTGDHSQAAHWVAQRVGLSPEQVRSGVLPGDKRDVVAQLQQQGHVVAMVGDGINDAAALAQAGQQGLGFAMGSGTDVARHAADITLMRSDLAAVVTAIDISRATLRIIKQNLFWAFAYNVAALPLAIAGLLNPMIAGAAMACSSVIVVTNSLRLNHAGGKQHEPLGRE